MIYLFYIILGYFLKISTMQAFGFTSRFCCSREKQNKWVILWLHLATYCGIYLIIKKEKRRENCRRKQDEINNGEGKERINK